MFMKKGKGPWAVMPVGCGLSALLMAGAANAALVNVSGVVTNNTATTQSYQFSQKVKVSEYIANVGVYGSFPSRDRFQSGRSLHRIGFGLPVHRPDRGIRRQVVHAADDPDFLQAVGPDALVEHLHDDLCIGSCARDVVGSNPESER